MPSRKLLWPALLATLASACTTPAGAPAAGGGSYVVRPASTQFYKYGPAQAFGADFALAAGQRITMVKREYGFSRVKLEDGQEGYLATEDLAPAPPPTPTPRGGPPLPPLFAAAQRATPKPAGTRSRPRRPQPPVQSIPGDPLFDVNDVPLPQADAPADTPRPQFRVPRPSPTFRY